MRIALIAVLVAALAGCPKHSTGDDRDHGLDDRVAVGVSLTIAGSALDKAAILDRGKLGPVGCVSSTVLGDVLGSAGSTVLAGLSEIPSFEGDNAIDVCACVERYGLPSIEGIDVALAASIEGDLSSAGVISGALVKGCKARAWSVAVLDFARGLPTPIAVALSRGECRIEIAGAAPDLTACSE